MMDNTLPPGSVNHAARANPTSATPFSVFRPGVSYSKISTPPGPQLSELSAQIADTPRRLRLRVSRASRAGRKRNPRAATTVEPDGARGLPVNLQAQPVSIKAPGTPGGR